MQATFEGFGGSAFGSAATVEMTYDARPHPTVSANRQGCRLPSRFNLPTSPSALTFE